MWEVWVKKYYWQYIRIRARVIAFFCRIHQTGGADGRRFGCGQNMHPTPRMSGSLTELRRPLTELRRPLTELRRPLTELRRPLTELRRPLTELRRPLTELRRPLTKLRRPLTRVSCDFAVADFHGYCVPRRRPWSKLLIR